MLVCLEEQVNRANGMKQTNITHKKQIEQKVSDIDCEVVSFGNDLHKQLSKLCRFILSTDVHFALSQVKDIRGQLKAQQQLSEGAHEDPDSRMETDRERRTHIDKKSTKGKG